MTEFDPDFKPKALRRPGIARRAAVLEAATDVFLEQGYERASLGAINARAGGSKTLIYEQFGDKAGLFRAVMTQLCENALMQLDTDATAGRPPVEVLTELGRRFMAAVCGDASLSVARTVFSEGPRHPDIADGFLSQYDNAFEQLAQYLETISARPIPDGRRRQLAMLFFTMAQGDAFDRKLAQCSRQRSQAEIEDQIALAVKWLLDCVAPAAP